MPIPEPRLFVTEDGARITLGGRTFELIHTPGHALHHYCVVDLDHELIFSLGITSILNVPIRHAGRRLGTVNLCGEEGMYGPAEIAHGKVLAALLVPSLLVVGD